MLLVEEASLTKQPEVDLFPARYGLRLASRVRRSPARARRASCGTC